MLLTIAGLRVEPWHILQVISSNEPQLNRQVVVREDGLIVLPIAGTLAAAGLEPKDIELAIVRAANMAGVGPGQVQVTVCGYARPVVRFSGAVTLSGEIRWSEGLRLDDIRHLSKSPTGSQVTIISFAGKETAVSEGQNPGFQPGDRVVFRVVGGSTQILVLGQVRRPGEIRWNKGMTVAQAIGAAGGLIPLADASRIKIKRDTEILGAMMDDPVLAGDTIQVSEVAIPQYVDVKGAVSRPARLALSEAKTLLKALEGCGWTLFNAQDEITIFRAKPKPSAIKVSYKDLKAGKVKDPVLQSGDVVEVKFKPRKVS